MSEERDAGHGPPAADEAGALDAEIDETLKDSFPASDPPSWTLGTDHHVESRAEEAEEDDNPPRH